MKIKIIITIYVFFALISCRCEHCYDNLTAMNKKIPYTNNSLVAFKNDTLGIIYDTVQVAFGNPNDVYGCVVQSDEDLKLCGAYSELKYSNFGYLEISQGDNFHGNEIAIFSRSLFGYYTELINYNYRNKIISVINLNYVHDTVGSAIWKKCLSNDSTFIYNDYYFMVDTAIKLIQYSTVYKDGSRRIWRLEE